MTALNVQQLALHARATSGAALSFTVEAGRISALFGRPGSGVREALRVIAGLEPTVRGEVRLDDVPVQSLPAHRRRIGLVQRDSTLFPGTVEDNIRFGLKHAGWPKSDRGRRVAEVLELVGMTGAEGDNTTTLTEGERARVILARAIAPQPAALLVEAPTWFVPEVDRIAFRGRLREVFQSLDIPILISTHDVQDAVGIADDLLVVHEGALRQSGSVSRVLAGPNSIEVAELVGYVTLVRGEVKDGWILEPGAGAIDYPAGFPLQGTARALAHPAVMLGVPDESGLGCGVAGTLERVRAIGPTHLLDIRVGERTIEVRWEWDLNPPEPDAIIAVAVTPGTLRFFNEPNTSRPAAIIDAAAGTDSATLPSAATAAAAEAPDETAEAEQAASDGETDTQAESADPSEIADTDRAESVEASSEVPSWEQPQEPQAPATPREFTPSEGLMAEPPPPRVEPATIAYDPEERLREESGATFIGSGAPAPAPSPPRKDVKESAPTAEDVEHAAERADDDSVEAMAPWLQVSRSPRPDDTEDDQPKRRDPHRGMPLD